MDKDNQPVSNIVNQWFDSFSCHNLNSVDPKSKMLLLSESLEKYVSNDVHQSSYLGGKNICQCWIIAHGPRPKKTNYGPDEILD